MNVSQLIAFLEKQPQHLTVVYRMCSEQCVLDENDMGVEQLCAEREDGWVPNLRPDKPSQTYFVLPGN